MSEKSEANGAKMAGCITLFILSQIIAIWTDRNLDFWASYIKGQVVDVPYWVSMIASLPVYMAFPANIIAEIVRYFV